MKIDIVTAFPDMVSGPLTESIIKRAIANGLVEIRVHNLRDWAKDRHRTLDDTPYGGGAGMIFKVEPMFECLSELTDGLAAESYDIFLTSPRGTVFSQEEAVKLSLKQHLILICGHYKGVDERIRKLFPVRELSIGDYILSGGELAALVVVDAVVRLLPGAISDINSALSDSFSDDLLDCDYYTRPEEFRGHSVPPVLMTGDHKKIDKWREERKVEITQANRPDLYEKYLKKLK
jgi:tRNA (guanine37-N1)-methyltransferase